VAPLRVVLLAGETGRFSTPDTYVECQDYVMLMIRALANPHFDMPAGVQSKEFCGGFIVVRTAVPGDGTTGKAVPLFVVELPHCVGVNGCLARYVHALGTAA
jgi:hypothetical protein